MDKYIKFGLELALEKKDLKSGANGGKRSKVKGFPLPTEMIEEILSHIDAPIDMRNLSKYDDRMFEIIESYVNRKYPYPTIESILQGAYYDFHNNGMNSNRFWIWHLDRLTITQRYAVAIRYELDELAKTFKDQFNDLQINYILCMEEILDLFSNPNQMTDYILFNDQPNLQISQGFASYLRQFETKLSNSMYLVVYQKYWRSSINVEIPPMTNGQHNWNVLGSWVRIALYIDENGKEPERDSESDNEDSGVIAWVSTEGRHNQYGQTIDFYTSKTDFDDLMENPYDSDYFNDNFADDLNNGFANPEEAFIEAREPILMNSQLPPILTNPPSGNFKKDLDQDITLLDEEASTPHEYGGFSNHIDLILTIINEGKRQRGELRSGSKLGGLRRQIAGATENKSIFVIL